MTMTEMEPDAMQIANQIFDSYDGRTPEQQQVYAEQVEFYVTQVKPKVTHQEYLGSMALNHPNIILGEE